MNAACQPGRDGERPGTPDRNTGYGAGSWAEFETFWQEQS